MGLAGQQPLRRPRAVIEMWLGQLNAILFLCAIGSAIAGYLAGSIALCLWLAGALIAMRLVLGILNILSMAFRGRPLLYRFLAMRNRGGDWGGTGSR